MKRSLFAVVLAMVLVSTANATAQTRKSPAGSKSVSVVKVSDFDPSIRYSRCDPPVKGGPSRLVWPFPGQSPLVPPDLLRRAGLNGRNDLDFDRAVLGPREGENMPEDQRVALGLVQKLIRAGVLKVAGDEDDSGHTWEKYQTWVQNNEHHARDLALKCGDAVGVMGYAAGSEKNGNPKIYIRRDYVMGFTPSVWAWSVGPILTPTGWKRIDTVLDCFNPRAVPAEAPPVPAPVPAAAALAAAPKAASVPPVLLVPAVQKRWFDSKGKEVDPPKRYSLRFMAREKATGRVVTTLDYAYDGSGFAPSGMFGPEAKSMFKAGNSYVLVEDPTSIPKGWHSRGPVEFTVTEGNGSVPPLVPVNEKDKSRWGCGPAKVYCWGPFVGAGIAYWALHRGGSSNPASVPPASGGKTPQPPAPRPIVVGFSWW